MVSPFNGKIFSLDLRLTTRVGLNVYRLVTGFGYPMDVKGPLVYLNDLSHWEGFAAPILLSSVIWIGDALVVSWQNGLESIQFMPESASSYTVAS
jgi:hypothetical protein